MIPLVHQVAFVSMLCLCLRTNDHTSSLFRFVAMLKFQQPEGGLGERMAAVIHAGLCDGRHTVIICGGDIPSITAAEVDAARLMLRPGGLESGQGEIASARNRGGRADDHRDGGGGDGGGSSGGGGSDGTKSVPEMVLGPAADGGYYLVGVSSLGRAGGPRSLAEYMSLFSSDAIAWGTGTVRAQQLARAAEVSALVAYAEIHIHNRSCTNIF